MPTFSNHFLHFTCKVNNPLHTSPSSNPRQWRIWRNVAKFNVCLPSWCGNRELSQPQQQREWLGGNESNIHSQEWGKVERNQMCSNVLWHEFTLHSSLHHGSQEWPLLPGSLSRPFHTRQNLPSPSLLQLLIGDLCWQWLCHKCHCFSDHKHRRCSVNTCWKDQNHQWCLTLL